MGQVDCAVARKDGVALAVTVVKAGAPVGAVADEGAIEEAERAAIVEDGTAEAGSASARSCVGLAAEGATSPGVVVASGICTAAAAETSVATIAAGDVAFTATGASSSPKASVTAVAPSCGIT